MEVRAERFEDQLLDGVLNHQAESMVKLGLEFHQRFSVRISCVPLHVHRSQLHPLKPFDHGSVECCSNRYDW